MNDQADIYNTPLSGGEENYFSKFHKENNAAAADLNAPLAEGEANFFQQFHKPSQGATQEPDSNTSEATPNYNTDSITGAGLAGAAINSPHLIGTAKGVRNALRAKNANVAFKRLGKVPVLNLAFAADDALGELTGGYQVQGPLGNLIGGAFNLANGEKFYDGSLHDFFSTNRHEDGDPFGATQRSKYLGNRLLGAADAFGNTLFAGGLDAVRYGIDSQNMNHEAYDEATGRQSDPYYAGHLSKYLAEHTIYPNNHPADPRFKNQQNLP
jgi:hypothetical protein